MALIPKLEMRHSQTLVMTPQLQQAIKLLQLSNLDLSAYVTDELERNPLLVVADDKPPADPDGAGALAGEAQHGGPETGGEDGAAMPALDLAAETNPGTIAEKLDASLDNMFPDEASLPGNSAVTPMETGPASGMSDSGWASLGTGARGGSFDGQAGNLEATLTQKPTLADHLTRQLEISLSNPADILIGLNLIDMVGEDGYLHGDPGEVAERLGAPPEQVEAVLDQLREFDPPGVFARNLAECLAMQLKEKNRLDPAIQAVLDHLDLLARGELAKLMKLAGTDREDLTDIIEEIRSLNPKPGLAFGSTVIQPVVPDVFVREGADGNWIVELNSETLPRVLVDRQYYGTVARSAKNPEEKTFLSECLATASWLVKSLDQRAQTILKTAREIVRQQDRFLVDGVQYLRPLNLKAVADAISMHESTISRVTSNKYMATPRGIFELKYFFSSSIASVSGDDAFSAEAVRHHIRALIDKETPTAILSDDKIVERLRQNGIDIARRTVAKYREAMKIPSSVQRRRAKKLQNEQV